MTPGFILDAVRNLELHALNQGGPGVSDLAAHLGVERRLVEHEVGVLLGLHHVHEFCVGGMGRVYRVAHELRRLGDGLALGGSDDDIGLPRRPAALTLLRHLGVKAGDIHRQPALRREQLGHVEREAVGVVELKGQPA